MFVNQPVLEAPVVVAYVEPTPVVEYMANVCTTRFLCGVRDSSTFRCLSGPSDHIDSGADSLPTASVPIATAQIAIATVKTLQLRSRVRYPHRKLHRRHSDSTWTVKNKKC